MSGLRSIMLLAASVLCLSPTLVEGAAPAPLDGAMQVVAGEAHSCVLYRRGAVACWGSNEHGELGTGNATLTLRETPVPVIGLSSGVRAIAAGYYHTCAVLSSGGVRCWGWNISGQLGSGQRTFENEVVPLAVLGIADAVEITAGGMHTCVRNAIGAVGCWGANERGQLGIGRTSEFEATAVAVVNLGGAAASLDAGGEHSCAVLQSGSARCWGRNDLGMLGDGTLIDRNLPTAVQIPQNLRAIGAAARHTCAVTTVGAVSCWGTQLLYPNDTGEGGSTTPRPFPGLESGWIAIDSGVFHTCALNSTGAIRCLGTNSLGQFGNGGLGDSFAAEATINLDPGVVSIGTGGDHSCAVTSRGGAQCWGRNNDGQLGIDRSSERLVPTQVSTLNSGVLAVGAGSFHGCALLAGGRVKCWGSNDQNQLGDGGQTSHLIADDVVGLTSGVRQLAVGHDHNCVVLADRNARCWGANFDGRLGDGSMLNRSTPVAVLGLDAPVAFLAQGRQHGCALRENGEVRCWGDNSHGQLGNGSTTASLSAVPVTGLGNGVRQLAVGFFHNCAVTAAGAMKCWGLNNAGQLGDGSTTNRTVPVDVVGLSSGVAKMGAGESHTCAVNTAGAVSCWGASFFGRLLGDESPTDRAVPGPVPSLTRDVVDISLGGFHTCVRLANSSMRCWGDNNAGAIGDNSKLSRGVPTPVAGLTRNVSNIDAGFGGQTCAVVAGSAQCWGENTFGQLGDGSSYGRPVPTRVVVRAEGRRVLAIAAAANAASGAAKSDASGRFLVFQSRASNLIGSDTNNGTDIFRRDRESGRIERVSLDNAGTQIGGDSLEPTVSANGQLVAFVTGTAAAGKLRGESSKATELRRKTSGSSVLLRNMLTGTTVMVAPAMPTGTGTQPQISASATTITFVAMAGAAGSPSQPNVFTAPITMVAGNPQVGTPVCISCKSINANGSASTTNSDGVASQPQLSADGRYLAYSTTAKNTLAATPSPCPAATSSSVVLRDLLTGIASVVAPPATTPAASCGSTGSSSPSIAASGQTVAFASDQPLSTDDGNGVSDIYVWQAGSTTLSRASDTVTGGEGSGASSAPSLSGDGTQLAFVSASADLDLTFADNNDRLDVHTVDLISGDLNRLSRGNSGAETSADSLAPSLNFDGSRVLFESASTAFGLNGLTGGVVERVNVSAPTTRSATWWLDAESGWGLSIFDQGNVIVPAWFTYDTDGEPTWFFVPGAFPQADGSFRGDLQRLSGVRFDQISGPATSNTQTIGSATFRFLGDDVLEFAYTVSGVTQSKRMTRFPFGARTFSCAATPDASRTSAGNVSDLWTGTNPNAGWGLTLFQIDSNLFGAWYTYDVDGEAIFLVLATSKQTDGSFTGSLFRQRNGTPFSMINGQPPSVGSDNVGSVTLRFSDGANGTFRYVVGGVDQTKPITRLLVGSRPTECASDALNASE